MQVDAWSWLDDGDLDAVCGSGVGEDDPALGEGQWLWGEEGDAAGLHIYHCLVDVGYLKGDVVDSFSPGGDEGGDVAAVVHGGNEADGSIFDVESGTFETGVCVVPGPEHCRAQAEEPGVGGHRPIEISHRYADVEKSLDHFCSVCPLKAALPAKKERLDC